MLLLVLEDGNDFCNLKIKRYTEVPVRLSLFALVVASLMCMDQDMLLMHVRPL